MGQRENKVELHLKREVNRIGGESRKWASPQHSFVPDQIVFYKGDIYFAEVKTRDGKLSSGQEREHARLRAQGANVVVVTGREGVDNFITALELSQ